jgi:hypothetical protein
MRLIASLVATALVVLLFGSNTNHVLSQKAEPQMQMPPTSEQQPETKATNGTQNSFTAKGTINTLFFIIVNNTLLKPPSENISVFTANTSSPDELNEGISISNVSNALNLADKSIADGNWTIAVENGKPVEFTANISSIQADGTVYHTHELANLTSDSKITLRPDNSTDIKGKIDVGLNGETAWKGVDATINIAKGKAITVILDDNDTENHFKEQFIYGRVNSFVF